MDFTLISGLVGSLKATYDLGNAAIGVRDANKLSEAVVEMNNKLLDAQQRLFAISGAAWALQQQLVDAQQKNLELETALQERGRYSLVEIAKGNFALKSKVEASGTGNPVDAEPVHYVCQPCFHKGVKAVLGFTDTGDSFSNWACPVCKREIFRD
ncbi:hypothetical protein [Variovorax sp. EBFNA2]|uniref:hypothetical protein n=1 Tax=Variovorax sp. EBFNA2 TaxID=3342097 RepID=UPI0029C02955|nr:hypothetical protein [Variovorax boronicumulans]WPG35152.1 hypothetical protein RZE79_16805 [Variovorax boronicumulans]